MSAKADLIEKLEWDPLFIASKEALKMIKEDFISDNDAKKELADFCKENNQGYKSVLFSTHKYKLNIINDVSSYIQDGVFSHEDFENLQNYYNRQDMTIFATPRELNAETEMAWSIIYPLIDRYERWKKVKELYEAQVIGDDHYQAAKSAVISGELFDDDLSRSILFLDRMKYAREKGIIDGSGYQKAVKLIPIMKADFLGQAPHVAKMNSEEIVEALEQGDKMAIQEEVAVEENTELNEFTQDNDPILQWKRLVLILVDAWESMIKFELKEKFKPLIEGNDVPTLQEIHKFLVNLNKEYMSSDKRAEEKNQYFLEKIEQFLIAKK